ncbi:MAG: 16S rRNA (cytidine(1402)-2'-O)-methyltransferase [Actinomycetota bacterium]
MGGTLYVVGTPIGNLADLTERARAVLASVDLVACEDTRRTGRLLAHVGVEVPMRSFFAGNESERTDEIVAALRGDRDVALVSDAGMPGISDPGFPLVRACVAAGIPIVAVPGASAVTAALVVSGFPMDRFVFEGVLPRAGAARRERLAALAREERTAVLFESPRRVDALLGEVVALLDDRRVAVCRELTKLHEEVLRGRASEVLAAIGDRELKGEVAVVIEGATRPEADLDALIDAARGLVARGARKRDAAATVARGTPFPAADVYAALLDRP